MIPSCCKVFKLLVTDDLLLLLMLVTPIAKPQIFLFIFGVVQFCRVLQMDLMFLGSAASVCSLKLPRFIFFWYPITHFFGRELYSSQYCLRGNLFFPYDANRVFLLNKIKRSIWFEMKRNKKILRMFLKLHSWQTGTSALQLSNIEIYIEEK